MTYASTPSPAAIPQERRARKMGTKLTAVIVTVAAGAAIAFGISAANEVAAPTPAVNENPELLKHDQAIDDDFNMSRRTPRGAGGAAGASTMTNEEFTRQLIESGRLPQGAIPKGNQATRVPDVSGPR